MDTLRQLTELVTKNKLKSIELLDTSKTPKSLLTQLYEGIADGQFADDQEAADFFYPDKNPALYRKLKNKLRRRLVNALLLIDVKKASYSDRKSAYYECYKEWAAVRVLLAKNAWTACVEIAERILKYAIKFDFTELTLDLIGILRLHYGTRLGDLKKFEEYKKLYLHYEAVFLAENKAELLYTELVVHYVNNKSTKTELRDQALEALGNLSTSLDQYSSYRLHLYGSMIRLMISSIINNHAQTIQTCNDIITFFEKKPYRAETPLQAAYYQKLVCHCQLKDFTPGQAAAKKCLELIEEGTVNWFKYYEMYFILAMHTGNYAEAAKAFSRVNSHKGFSYLPDNTREIWLIYQAYLHLIAEKGLLSKELATEVGSKQFKPGKFLNEVEIYARDKSGMNIPIIVFQLVYFILQGRTDQIIDRLDAIRKYCARHLDDDTTTRSFYFIKALLLRAQSVVGNEEKREKAEDYLKKVTQIQADEDQQLYQIEIIPYEKLWNMLETQQSLN